MYKKPISLFACNVDEAERNVNKTTNTHKQTKIKERKRKNIKLGLELELIDTKMHSKRGGATSGEMIVQGNTRKLMRLSVKTDRAYKTEYVHIDCHNECR